MECGGGVGDGEGGQGAEAGTIRALVGPRGGPGRWIRRAPRRGCRRTRSRPRHSDRLPSGPGIARRYVLIGWDAPGNWCARQLGRTPRATQSAHPRRCQRGRVAANRADGTGSLTSSPNHTVTTPHAFPLEPTPIHVRQGPRWPARPSHTDPSAAGRGEWGLVLRSYPSLLILTHGWRWTFWHWSMVIDPLTDPTVFGGDLARSMNVGQQTPQQIRADVGEAIDQDLVQVDSVDIGHRVVLPRVTLVGLTRSYAMLPSLGYDTMVRSDSVSYTIFMEQPVLRNGTRVTSSVLLPFSGAHSMCIVGAVSCPIPPLEE